MVVRKTISLLEDQEPLFPRIPAAVVLKNAGMSLFEIALASHRNGWPSNVQPVTVYTMRTVIAWQTVWMLPDGMQMYVKIPYVGLFSGDKELFILRLTLQADNLRPSADSRVDCCRRKVGLNI